MTGRTVWVMLSMTTLLIAIGPPICNPNKVMADESPPPAVSAAELAKRRALELSGKVLVTTDEQRLRHDADEGPAAAAFRTRMSEYGQAEDEFLEELITKSDAIDRELRAPNRAGTVGSILGVLEVILGVAAESAEWAATYGMLSPKERGDVQAINAALNGVRSVTSGDANATSDLYASLGNAALLMANSGGRSIESTQALIGVSGAMYLASDALNDPSSERSDAVREDTERALSLLMQIYADPMSSSVSANSGPRGTNIPSGNCPKDLSHVIGKVRAPELRADMGTYLNPIDDTIVAAGGLDRAILLTRGQIREYEQSLDVHRANVELRSLMPERHRAHVIQLEDAIVVNQAYLAALECRRRSPQPTR